MTKRSIEEQVEILRTTTERAGVSREAASDFLRSAGISHRTGRERSEVARSDDHFVKRSAASGKFVSKKIKK